MARGIAIGSIGIATLSDCRIPYWAETFLGMEHAHVHLGIVEMPLIIIFTALPGIGLTCWHPKTHFPHAGHVLLSMAASFFHILRTQAGSFSVIEGLLIALFLFAAVWIPCCLSGIISPPCFSSTKKIYRPITPIISPAPHCFSQHQQGAESTLGYSIQSNLFV